MHGKAALKAPKARSNPFSGTSMAGAAWLLAAIATEPAMASEASQRRTLQRPDGSRLVFHVTAKPGAPGLFLVAQGSGCELALRSVAVQDAARLASGGRDVVVIEKYGVDDGSPADVDGCSQPFWDRNTLQQRAVDALQVIEHLRRERSRPQPAVLFGGSEGGAVVALLAPLLHQVDVVVVVPAGIGVPVRRLVADALPPLLKPLLASRLAASAREPTGRKRFAGHSQRWWADAADVAPAKALSEAGVPVLLIHGALDRSAPVSTARAARDLLTKAGVDLTYRELPDHDHALKDQAGVNRRAEVLAGVGH